MILREEEEAVFQVLAAALPVGEGRVGDGRNQKISRIERFFVVDPTGVAPASSGANTDMLLHTPQARVHASIIKRKRGLSQGTLFVAPDFSP